MPAPTPRRIVHLTPLILTAALLLFAATPEAQAPATPAAPAQPPQAPTFSTGVETVYVNVIVRDKAGQPVRGLKAEDFVITEDGKPQALRTFAYEEAVTQAAAEPEPPSVLAPLGTAKSQPSRDAGHPGMNPPGPAAPTAATSADYHGRRLMVLFFDLSAMQPEEIERMAVAAKTYVETKLAPADLVAVVSLSQTLQVLQDFTDDRAALLKVLAQFDPNANVGFAEGASAETAAAAADATADTGGEFVPDDSEFTLFNTDRRLQALGDVAATLGAIEQRKSILYFSGGMGRSGSDNQVLLRKTIARAVRANVSIYTMDARGLTAAVPGGEASEASPRGTGAFTGAAQRGRVDQTFAAQEALSALARDTGGQAVFDSNAFGEVFDRVVSDTSAYYILGYESTNPRRDGRYRRIKVETRTPGYRLEHRNGYYATRDFQHSTRADREQQLQDQITAELPATDLPVYLSAAYFRLSPRSFAVPVTIAVPGSKIPFVTAGDKAKATLDLLGLVIDDRRRPIARVRDTVALAAPGAAAASRIIQYQTTQELPPGRYRMKVVVRENELGTMGAFENDVVVPALDGDRVKVSSVVLGTRLGAEDRSRINPLATVAEGLVPTVVSVVSARQRLYFYFEVYDPRARASEGAQRSAPVKVLASLSFLRGGTRVYQTGVVDVTQLAAPDRGAAAFRLEVAPGTLAPGVYTCQVNVIDDVAGAFVFPRLTVAVRP
jgi:VWFA-related protein